MTKRTDGPSAACRIRVMKRDRFTCTYCGVAGTDAELEVDHIIAVAKGGSHHISNLTTACRACNQAKGTNSATPKRVEAGPPAPLLPSDAHPLVGMFFHTFCEDGDIEYQAHVRGVDGDTVIAQMFEWFHGEPSTVRTFEKAYLYSDRCRLYATRDDWLRGYERHCQRRKAHERRAAA